MIPHINKRNAFAHVPNVAFAVVITIALSVGFCQTIEINPGKCLVWGPGLNPDVVLPVRYFYIQTVDSQGKNITLSPGKNENKQYWYYFKYELYLEV